MTHIESSFCLAHGENEDEEEKQERGSHQVGHNPPGDGSYSHVHSNLPRSGSSARPRWRILPPEIIRMILQHLETDKETLRACSRTAHDFRHVAQSFLGRHIRVTQVDRLKECARLTARGAFQHVRSLDLGADKKGVILEEYWKDYLVILGSFSRYRTLNCLWLSEVPFTFTRPSQKKNLRETIIALGSTTTELGLYGCHFSSYEEMISLIRSFPLCKYLFIRNCVTRERATGRNALAGLPEHTLAIKDLQLSTASPASPSNALIDVSNLIEDAALDVGSLTSLVCDVVTFEGTQRVAAAVSASRVEHFQMACLQPEGFQGECGSRVSLDNVALTFSLKLSWAFFQGSGP